MMSTAFRAWLGRAVEFGYLTQEQANRLPEDDATLVNCPVVLHGLTAIDLNGVHGTVTAAKNAASSASFSACSHRTTRTP